VFVAQLLSGATWGKDAGAGDLYTAGGAIGKLFLDGNS